MEKRIFLQGALISAVLLLTACGGGTDENTQAATGGQRLQAQAVGDPTSDDRILTVQLDTSAAGVRTYINVKDTKTGTSTRIKLDNLPDYLASHPWVADNTVKGNLRVRFAAGTYEFDTQGWLWPANVSGKDSARNIVLERDPAVTQDVVFVGSKQVQSNVYDASTKVVKVTNLAVSAPFDQLWTVEDGRAVRARTPNVLTYYSVNQGVYAPNNVPTCQSNCTVTTGMKAYDDEYAEVVTQAAGNPDAELVFLYEWSVARRSIASANAATSTFTFDSSIAWPTSMPKGMRYYLENVESGLDMSKEWFFKGTMPGTGELRYKMSGSSSATSMRFEIPKMSWLLKTTGDAPNGKWVSNLRFSNLKFRYTNLPKQSSRDPQQGAVGMPSAIELSHARNIVFDRCEVSHVAGTGIWMRDSARYIQIDGSEVFDTGGSGVLIGSTPANLEWVDAYDAKYRGTDLETGRDTVSNSRIHDVGVRVPSANGIWIGHSSYNTLVGNVVRSVPHSGISVGWEWNAGPSQSHHNVIRANYLHKIGNKELSDLGGIYLLGRADGTIVEGNVIRDVTSYTSFAGHGIYLDEGSSNVTVRGNLVKDIDGAAYRQNDGFGNLVTNNVLHAPTPFIFQWIVGPTDGQSPFTLKNNALFPTKDKFAGGINSIDSMSGTWLAPAPIVADNKVSRQFASSTLPSTPNALCGCTFKDTLSMQDAGLSNGMNVVPTVSMDGAGWNFGGVQQAVAYANSSITYPGYTVTWLWMGDITWERLQ
ncbi:MAG TPA: right-handed parallel beta-helix repeat-containing protein [Aquabacterium sp.]|uniref:right-handed parallel beta-helix repeat-containing protein n=1 Tax=Aquabacterium sp. TaxID=1872578 RepID=UPI002E347159|nr:right-handed parallel beta-helix repeat-containing protein [Aquabacterium sp.]HEX5372991.1 right-handed parallel beta-helix repeat-containing protein [Aquabacterium sp.]